MFVPQHNPVPYVKRLIGKPGDKIRIINKQVYVNGKPITKTFYKTEESIITKRYRDLSGNITTREKDVVIDFFFEEHGGRNTLQEISVMKIFNTHQNGKCHQDSILLWEIIEIIQMTVLKM